MLSRFGETALPAMLLITLAIAQPVIPLFGGATSSGPTSPAAVTYQDPPPETADAGTVEALLALVDELESADDLPRKLIPGIDVESRRADPPVPTFGILPLRPALPWPFGAPTLPAPRLGPPAPSKPLPPPGGTTRSTIPPVFRPGGPPLITTDEMLANAERLLGIPYLWGGTTDAGLDCSAYLSRVWGVRRQTTDTLYTVAYPIPRDELLPGDALNLTIRQDPRGYGHVRLFAGWANAERTMMWVYEETPPKSVYHVIRYDPSYTPYRRINYVANGDIADSILAQPSLDRLLKGSLEVGSTIQAVLRPILAPAAGFAPVPGVIAPAEPASSNQPEGARPPARVERRTPRPQPTPTRPEDPAPVRPEPTPANPIVAPTPKPRPERHERDIRPDRPTRVPSPIPTPTPARPANPDVDEPPRATPVPTRPVERRPDRESKPPRDEVRQPAPPVRTPVPTPVRQVEPKPAEKIQVRPTPRPEVKTRPPEQRPEPPADRPEPKPTKEAPPAQQPSRPRPSPEAAPPRPSEPPKAAPQRPEPPRQVERKPDGEKKHAQPPSRPNRGR